MKFLSSFYDYSYSDASYMLGSLAQASMYARSSDLSSFSVWIKCSFWLLKLHRGNQAIWKA